MLIKMVACVNAASWCSQHFVFIAYVSSVQLLEALIKYGKTECLNTGKWYKLKSTPKLDSSGKLLPFHLYGIEEEKAEKKVWSIHRSMC